MSPALPYCSVADDDDDFDGDDDDDDDDFDGDEVCDRGGNFDGEVEALFGAVTGDTVVAVVVVVDVGTDTVAFTGVGATVFVATVDII
jgi:hypothetical protein